MKTITISEESYNTLARITKLNTEKEACALLFAKITNNGFHLESVLEVRNTRRIALSFGISKADFEKHNNQDLIGIFHSHFHSTTLSEKDELIFKNKNSIQFQLIGLKQKSLFNLFGFTNTLNNLKIKIL